MTTTRLALVLLLCGLSVSLHADAIRTLSQTVAAHGKRFAVTGVVIDLHDAAITMKVGLAWGAVGRTESLAGIAKRYGAVAAINGSFFDAYTKDELKNPDMSLISAGQLIYKSNLGAMLGFTADNTPYLGLLRHKLGGTVTSATGRPQSWYAYWMNRKPTAANSATLFTRAWGERLEPMGGTSIVITDGIVTAITQQAVTIPEHGYILHIRGERSLRARFQVGSTVTLATQTTVNGSTNEHWNGVQEAVGAGPRVLVNGAPVFNPTAEGFSDPKILQQVGARSAAGYTATGQLYLITTRAATVADLGYILQALGCTDGMNLDGGASSGLWYRGNYLTTPGRQVGNALLVLPRP